MSFFIQFISNRTFETDGMAIFTQIYDTNHLLALNAQGSYLFSDNVRNFPIP
jgi:hypothetical protein